MEYGEKEGLHSLITQKHEDRAGHAPGVDTDAEDSANEDRVTEAATTETAVLDVVLTARGSRR